MADPLSGQVALVTGAASGIGAATAVELASQGAKIIALDIGSFDALRAKIAAVGGEARFINCDVARESSVKDAVRHGVGAFHRLDMAVNCAGIVSEQSLLETTAEQFDKVMAINVRGTFLVGREAIRVMSEQGGGGRVINVASELAFLGRANYSAYCCSKAAVLGLARTWAREFAPRILVNTVAPGPTDTPLLTAEEVSQDVFESESNIPLGRLAQPEEIASVIAFLCGPRATFLTGQTISPNGGAFFT